MLLLQQPSRALCVVLPALFLALSGTRADADTTEPVSTARLSDVFKKLGSDDFITREVAQQELQELASSDEESTLDKALDKYLATEDPEVRFRLRSAMYGAVAANSRRKGFIGITMEPEWMRARGGQLRQSDSVRITNVHPGTAADKFGLQAGDEIIEIDGKAFTQNHREPNEQLQLYVRSLSEGDPLRLTIRRGGKQQKKEIKLSGMPDQLDPNFRETAFSNWMHDQLVERGLAEPRPTIMPSSQRRPTPVFPGVDPRFVPAPRIAPVPIPPENLFPEE